MAQQKVHRSQRDTLRADYLATRTAIRRARYQNRPTGLAGFLGRVCGVNLIRQKVHHYQDGQRLQAYRIQNQELKATQRQEQKLLELRLKVQFNNVERKTRGLDKVENRELAALERDQRREQRERARGFDNAMPSLSQIAGQDPTHDNPAPDLLSAFGRTKRIQSEQVPDLMAAFAAAAKSRGERDERGETGSGLDKSERTHSPAPNNGRGDRER